MSSGGFPNLRPGSSRGADIASAIIEHLLDLVFVIDAGGRVCYASPNCIEAFAEREALDVVGVPWEHLFHDGDSAAATSLLLAEGFGRAERLRLACSVPEWAHVEVRAHRLEDDRINGVIAQCRRIAGGALPERMHGPDLQVCVLPTRAFIAARIDEILAVGKVAAAFFVDLDRFGRVNDFHGRDAGDEALRLVANRLSSMGDGMSIAAVGGAQFLVLAEHVDHVEEALALAERIARTISAEMAIERFTLELASTIGIALAPMHGSGSSEVIRSAEIATATGKKSLRGSIVLYRGTMQSRIADLREDEVELRRGLALRQLHLAYQPEIDLQTGMMVGAEALVRWPDFKHSIERLIRAAEDAHLIVPLGEIVLDMAIKEAARWLHDGHPQRIAINVSPEQVHQGVILSSLERVLDLYGLPASYVEIEITEHIVLEQSADAIRTLGRLRALGATIAIDDFGTGYSSLAYLRRFPVDKIKIDGSFVVDMAENARDAALVDAIVSVGSKLGLVIVAEGVEEMAQAIMLRDMGCHLGQGYLFGRPGVAEHLPWDRAFLYT